MLTVRNSWRAGARTLAVVVALWGLVACGSTVQPGSGAAGTVAASNGLSVGGNAPTTSGADTSGLSVPGGGAPVAGQSGTTAASTQAGPAGVAATTGPASTGGTAGPSQALPTAGSIKVGVMYSTDMNQVIDAVGAKGISIPDYRQVAGAVISYMNKNGGIAGHTVVPSYYDVHATDSSQQISEGACTQWTQDDHAFAVVPMWSSEDNTAMRECLGHNNTLGLYANAYSETEDASFASSRLWFELESMSLETLARTYVSALAQRGFFRGANVGVVYDEYPQFTAVANRVLIPAIKAAGGNVKKTFASSVHSYGDLGPGGGQMGNAVLQFRAAGVDHVVFFDAWAVTWALFAQNAQQQHWKPSYGLSSQDLPQDGVDSGLLPLQQLPGTKFVGWNVSMDVRRGTAGIWPRVRLCSSILSHAAVDFKSHGAEGYQGSMAVCGALLTFQDAGRRLGNEPLSQSSFANALQNLGWNLQNADQQVSRFTPDRHYGAAGWRPGDYVESCQCFKYSGGVTKF